MKNSLNKKILVYLFFFIIFSFLPTDNVFATGFDSTYRLLAPIGEMTDAPTSYGDYINKILEIIIGLCGALAVIMIVIGGVQYMGDESVFGKTEAKSSIVRAIFGLLIALGSYALLNTINPDLLSTKVNVKSVSSEISEALVSESSGLPAPGQPLGDQCPGGRAAVIVNGTTIMNTCQTIASQVTNLITQARAAGYNISGSSFRSYADQMSLRRKNCPDPERSRADECNPPTAPAGTSLHESGLAIDFKCDGVIIQTTDNRCYLWLKDHASQAGLLNLAGEPWHWSTTGH